MNASMPAAGYRNNNDGSPWNRGSNGNYWSSSAYNTNNAWNFNFNCDELYENNNNRANGYAVVPVPELKMRLSFYFFIHFKLAMITNNIQVGTYVSPAIKMIQINARNVMCTSPGFGAAGKAGANGFYDDSEEDESM